ncbi:hypothetical protein NM208_g14074 [Fusarium decemcellulare]|uniref:Uncharacterized protein n=1 Tax=Fusarium decemcellulare TaxID=57161 RepID=A0ACC1RIM9_9HYPO|nr:hypothetical protein NM208_g14074 [Fusarium decemcellulare]
MLGRMPPEVLDNIARQLPKVDLKSLTLVSAYLRRVAAPHLWTSIVVFAPDESNLDKVDLSKFPRSAIRYASHLSFSSSFRSNIKERCIHPREGFPWPPWRSISEPEEYSHTRFGRFCEQAVSILELFKKGQLRSFSWNMGTCIPDQILGTQGILACLNPSLEALSLTTDADCVERQPVDMYGEQLSLAPFHNLKRLCWRAPRREYVVYLDIVLENNAHCLEDFELDMVDWNLFYDYYDTDGLEDELEYGGLFGIRASLSESLFLNLSRLSLSQVEVGPGMIHLFNFHVLRSLTLRKCPGWAKFLDSIQEAELLLRLKTLEVQDYDSDDGAMRSLYLLCLLEISIGLEELYLNIDKWPGALLSLAEISKDQPTLKRFAQYPTVKDDPKLGKSELLATMERRDLPNPLGSLDLEAYGLTCNPRFISFLDQKQTLQSFSTRHTLKVVHIRPVRGMMEDSYLHPVVAGSSRQSSRSDNYSGRSSGKATHEDTWASLPLGLRYEFRPVAKWAFGRQGLASLKLIIFGDFAYECRNGRHNFMLCRSSDGQSNFRCLARESYEWKAVVEEYRNLLESCPSEPLLKMGYPYNSD